MVSAVHYRHPKGKCVISGHVFPKGYIGQWNHRATTSDPRDEVIAKMIEALEDVVKNENWLVNQKFKGKSEWFDLSMQRAALAAAKAMQK